MLISWKKVLCSVLAFVFILSFFPMTFSAEETVPDAPAESTVSEEPEKVDLKKQIVDESEVPDLIDYSVVVEKKYVKRSYERESSLNEVVFLRADGAFDRYTFSFPVKYEANGEILDKNPELTIHETLLNGKYRFASTEHNDLSVFCSDTVSDGTVLVTEEMNVTLKPISETEYNFLRGYIEEGLMAQTPTFTVYSSTAAAGTAQSAIATEEKPVTAATYTLSGQDSLSVVPSYTGFRVDVNLSATGSDDKVCFRLNTNGLIPVRQGSSLILYNKTGKPVGILGDLFPESGTATATDYTVTQLGTSDYLLCATVERSSESAVLSTSITSYYDYLQDTTLYSAASTTVAGSVANLYVGYNSSRGIQRILIRPNNWTFLQSSEGLQHYEVQTATLVMRDIMGANATTTVECRGYTGNVWTESTATWSNSSPNSYTAPLSQNVMNSDTGWSQGYVYTFDITQLVQNWYTGVSNWQKGLMLKASSANEAATTTSQQYFASTQYATEAYRPRIEVTAVYAPSLENGAYRIRNHYNSTYLTSGPTTANFTNVYQDTLNTSSYEQVWRIFSIGNGYYTIRPMHWTQSALDLTNDNVDIYSVITDESTFSDIPSYATWEVWFTHDSYGNPFCMIIPYGEGRCVSYVGYSDGAGGDVQIADDYGDTYNRWSFESATDYSPAILFYDTRTDTRVTEPVRYVSYGVTESLSDLSLKYSLSTATVIDPGLCSFESEDPNIVTVSNAYNIIGQSCGSVFITAYYNLGPSQRAEATFVIEVARFTEAAYCIKNVETNQYLATTPISESGIRVQSGGYYGADTPYWIFDVVDHCEGYGTISTTLSGNKYYMIYQGTSATQGAAILLSNQANDNRALWKIMAIPLEGYKIIPKNSGEDQPVLATYSDSLTENEVSVVLYKYQDASNKMDKWVLTRPRMEVEVVVDLAYQERNPDYVSRINQNLTTVKDKIYQLFGLTVSFSTINYDFRSYGDSCSNSNFNEFCECTTICESSSMTNDFEVILKQFHHKNFDNNFFRIEPPDISNSCKLALIGQTFCTPTKHDRTTIDQNLLEAPYGRAYVQGGLAVVGAQGNPQNIETLLIMHELCHLFYAPDHESLSDTQKALGFSDNCIYGANRTKVDNPNIVGDLTICQGCQTIIRQNIDRFCH